MTYTDFTKKHGITATSMWSARNPSFSPEEDRHMNHYKVTLRCDGRRMTLHYSKGKALNGEPTADEVLECLKLDMNCIEYGMEDFIDNFGYTESKGRRVYNTIEKQTEKLYTLLGHDKFEELKEIEEDE